VSKISHIKKFEISYFVSKCECKCLLDEIQHRFKVIFEVFSRADKLLWKSKNEGFKSQFLFSFLFEKLIKTFSAYYDTTLESLGAGKKIK
jgi:hypothetical protein